MIKGHVKCECGQEFWFETIMPEIECIGCGRIHATGAEDNKRDYAAELSHADDCDYDSVEDEEVLAEPSYEEELAHDYDLDHDAEEEDESE